MVRARRLVGCCFLSLIALPAAWGQATRLPTAKEVEVLKEQYRAERNAVLKQGADKRFLPVLVEKAEEMAARADKALAAGRLLQASEVFRQARWQLPYQSRQVPENVARVLGNLRLRHGQEINALAFSPAGDLLATASRDRTVKVWDLGNGHELLTYAGHGESVRAVAFRPGGGQIASGGADQDIHLWEPRTGKQIRVIKGEGVYVTALTYSKDGKYLVVSQAGKAGGSAGILAVYDANTGELKRKIDDFRLLVHHVAFNPEGNILGVGVGDGQIRLWQFPLMAENPATPPYWTQQDPNGATYHLAFSPDNRTLVRIGADGIKFYNLVQPGAPFQAASPRRHIAALAPPHRYTCAAFSRDGRSLFVGSTEGTIRVWDMETGQMAGTYKGHNAEIRGLAFNPGGTQLASASADYTVRLWDFDIVLQARDYKGHQGAVWTAFFDPAGRRIVSAGADKTVRIWEVGTAQVLHHLEGHTSPVTYALFSPDGTKVLSAGGDKVVQLWDAATGKPLRDFPGHTGTITCLDFHPNGKQAASGGVDRIVKIWDLESGKEIRSILDNRSVVAAVAYSPKGDKLAVGNVDQTIRIYDPATGKMLHQWTAHGVAVSGLAFSPDGRWLASCGHDHVVRVWPLEKPGENPIVLTGHAGPLSGLAFRHDSQHLASSGADGTVKLWKYDGATFKESQTFRGHKDWVSSVAFSRDGFYLASAGVDQVVKIWEITSREIPLITEHTGSVDAVAFSPDGKWLASAASDKSIKIWDRVTGLEKHNLQGHTDGILALAFSPDGKLLMSAGIDRNIRLWDPLEGKAVALVPGQQQAFTGLIAPVPYLVAPKTGKRLYGWFPHERYSTLTGWDPATGDEIFSFNDKRSVAACTFSADGRRAAMISRDGNLRIFDLEKKGTVLGGDWFVLEKGPAVGDIALAPDASFLVVTSEDGMVKVLDPEKRAVLRTFKGAEGRILACLVGPEGQRLVTVGQDNQVRLFTLADGKELRRWDLRAGPDDRAAFVHSLAFSPDGRQIAIGNANTTIFVLECP